MKCLTLLICGGFCYGGMDSFSVEKRFEEAKYGYIVKKFNAFSSIQLESYIKASFLDQHII